MEKILKILALTGILISFGVSAETLTNPETGQVWITDDNGAYTTDNSRLIKSGDNYFGSDGRIYLRQGNILMQIDGPRQNQREQVQKIQIQIQITAPPPITAPLIVPVPMIIPRHHHPK